MARPVRANQPGDYEFTVEARTLGHPTPARSPFWIRPSSTSPPASCGWIPPLAEFSAWYEMWARSQGKDPDRSATFEDMTDRLADIKDMGFDVIYLPPIHPIGVTKRKGANNALVAKPGEPGCPYAIGNKHGGHKAVDPELGTLAGMPPLPDGPAAIAGFAVALDFALNCSPDHPYVKAHPDWFYREKDGTIKCAENPPKRYEDVYPLNFFCEDRENLWREIKSVVEFWIGMGVDHFPGRQSPYQALRLLGMDDRRDQAASPGNHLPLRSLHPAQDHEAPGQARASTCPTPISPGASTPRNCGSTWRS